MKRAFYALALSLLVLNPVAGELRAANPADLSQQSGLPEGYAPSVAQPVSADDTAPASTAKPVDEPSAPKSDNDNMSRNAALQYGLVSSAHPEATGAGMDMLRQGGSATDAAMAMMLALSVVEPQSSGVGGGGFLLGFDAETGLLTTIDGRETAPAAIDERLFLDAGGNPVAFRDAFRGGQSVGVPGNIRLMAMAHEKSGKLPWKALFQPAIQLAEGGFEISPSLAHRLQQMKGVWRDFPAAQQLYWLDGEPAPAGTLVRNPALAATLTRVAELGPDAFYSGQTGQEIVRAVKGSAVNPGKLDMLDLSAYAAKERPALCLTYRIYKVCGMGPPSSGGTTVLQMLGMLERFDLAQIGPETMQSWHLIAEAMRLAYADREKYLGDADFVAVPVEGLLDPQYLKARSKLISEKKARGQYEAGTPAMAAPRTEAISAEVEGTTHFVAVDRSGNIASMTSTIEGPFGSQLIAAGMFLNNELTDFTFAPEKDGAPVANRVQPGKRPLSSMAPTVVFDASGRPILALGSAGGKRIIMHVVKTLIGVLDFGLTIEQAIAMPNLFFGGEGLLVEQGSGLETLAPKLAEFGHVVVSSPLESKVNGAQWTETDGWRAAADPRSEGKGMAQ